MKRPPVCTGGNETDERAEPAAKPLNQILLYHDTAVLSSIEKRGIKMLDTTKTPNASYLREKANLLKSTARLYEEFAYLQADAENRQHFFMLQDAIACLADRAAEVCALAEILDEYASPQEYGFSAEPENQTGKES